MTYENLRALGRKVREFQGLDTFPCPVGLAEVVMTGDEVTALCPVTGQPDWYTVTIRYVPRERCIESKSLKLYFQTYRNAGVFCEALAAQIADEVLRVVEPASVEVSVHQKPRGGISIDATARRTMSANSPG